MKRTALLLFFGFLLAGVLVAQEMLTFVAERDTIAYDWAGNEFVIHSGSIITTDNAVFYSLLHGMGSGNERSLLISFGEPEGEQSFSALAKNFRPLHTEDVFGEDIFIDYPMDRSVPNIINTQWGSPPAAIADAMWLPHYYADILRGQDRNMFLEIYPRTWLYDDGGNPWYTNAAVNLRHGRAMFFNSAIMLGDATYLAVRNIRRTDFGYRVDGFLSTLFFKNIWGALLDGSPFWERYNRNDAVTMLLFLDGDYLDIYTEGTDIHVGTFIRVGREFQTQYQSLIRHNISDLTNVQWPQRAGVSRAFPPPVITVEPPPEVAEPPIAVPVKAADIAAVEAPTVAAENAPATGAMPPLAWLAIGGAVLAAAGGGVAVRRKR